MRLIDADALEKRHYVAFKEVEAMPVITPKRGKWIAVTKMYKATKDKKDRYTIEWTPTYDPDEFEAFKCSECGEVFEIKDARNWCTQCGADMRYIK